MFTSSVLLPAIIVAVASYLVGSLSAAVIVCRLMGLPDPRDVGSKNPGATNVLRIGGKIPAALTLVGDALKGMLPVAVAGMVQNHEPTIALAGLAAFVGHLYPIFFGFSGGKGVATALGALLGLHPVTGLLALVTWLATSLVFRRSSLAALTTFVLVPLYLLIGGNTVYAVLYLFIGALLFYTHRANIRRLLDGTEPVIGR